VSVDKSLQHLWRPGTFAADPRKGRKPGAQQTKQVTRVEPAPSRTGKRPARKTLKPKPPPGPYKRSKPTPGSRQMAPKQKGKGSK
jgi:hypothetical protein